MRGLPSPAQQDGFRAEFEAQQERGDSGWRPELSGSRVHLMVALWPPTCFPPCQPRKGGEAPRGRGREAEPPQAWAARVSEDGEGGSLSPAAKSLSAICVLLALWAPRLEFEQALGDGEGQGSLAFCRPWGRKESDVTEQLNNSLKTPGSASCIAKCGPLRLSHPIPP